MADTPVGYKQTEVGIIPNDWDVSPFSKISYMKGRIGRQGLKKDEFNMNGTLPYLITGVNFKDGKIRWNEVYHVSWERFNIATDIQLKKDDVLMTKDGTIGKVLYVDSIPFPHKASLNSHLLLYRPLKNSYFPKFLYYQLSSFLFKNFVETNKSGSTLTGISQGEVGKYLVLLPPLPEQQAIATTLSDMDELIESLNELIEKKKNIKKGAMQKLLRPKKGWSESTLGEIITLCNGYAFQSSTYVENGKYKIVTITNVKNGIFDTSSFSMINDIPSNLQSHQILKIDDIIVSMTGNVGRVCRVTEKNCLLNQRVGVLKFKTNKVDKDYLYSILNSNLFEDDMIGKGHGAAQPNIGKPEIEGFNLYIPSTKEEQQEIATILSDMDKEIEALEEKKAKYEKIKEGAMQKLLTGKIRLV